MEPSRTALRWMWTWITIAVLVVLVVIGFLIGIANALESIDAGLEEANEAVVGANGDVMPLPAHIQDVNAALARVDRELRPIPRQASTIRGRLGSIRSTLGGVEGSLNATEGSLDATEGSLDATEGSLDATEGSLNRTSRSLANTSGTLRGAEANLVSIRRTAGRIDRRLELAQDARSLGTNGIWRRVRFLNGGRFFDASSVADRLAPPADRTSPLNRGGLRFVEGDADGIRGQLLDVSRHLTSICRQIPADLTPLPDPGNVVLSPMPGDSATPVSEC